MDGVGTSHFRFQESGSSLLNDLPQLQRWTSEALRLSQRWCFFLSGVFRSGWMGPKFTNWGEEDFHLSQSFSRDHYLYAQKKTTYQFPCALFWIAKWFFQIGEATSVTDLQLGETKILETTYLAILLVTFFVDGEFPWPFKWLGRWPPTVEASWVTDGITWYSWPRWGVPIWIAYYFRSGHQCVHLNQSIFFEGWNSTTYLVRPEPQNQKMAGRKSVIFAANGRIGLQLFGKTKG